MSLVKYIKHFFVVVVELQCCCLHVVTSGSHGSSSSDGGVISAYCYGYCWAPAMQSLWESIHTCCVQLRYTLPGGIDLKSVDVENVAEALMTMFSRVGVPKEILTDQSTNFTSKLVGKNAARDKAHQKRWYDQNAHSQEFQRREQVLVLPSTQ